MRVIAGEARGRRLEALPGTDVTRPTLSQVKEAMFSIVQFELPGARVLDLFAGSGQLGIEALSRGAARCVFLDESREAINVVMRNCKACGVFDRSRVSLGEAARYLSACREQFDLVLLDPRSAAKSWSWCCLWWKNAWRPAAQCCARAKRVWCCLPRWGR